MADEAEVVELESKAAPEVQEKALKMGWIPPERFKGDASKFVDADTFVERGEHFVPILQERVRKAEQSVEDFRAENARLAAAFKESQESIKALEEYHNEETTRQVKEARAKLKEELKSARADGDIDAEIAVNAELTRLNVAEETAKESKSNGADKDEQRQQQRVKEHPDYKGWAADNPWFGVDKRRTHLAMGVAQELIEARSPLEGRAFFDKITEEVEKTFGRQGGQQKRDDGVESGRRSGGRTGTGKSYNDLPADAKQACDGFANRLVGPNKVHKDIQSWRAAYAKKYFAEEQ